MIKENKEFNETLLKELKEKGLDLAKIKIKNNGIQEDFWDRTGIIIKPYDEQ